MRLRRHSWLVVLAVALLLAAVGVVYLLTECRNIPAPLPGRVAGSSDHRFGFAAAAFALAAVVASLAGAAKRRDSRSA
jgi:hypothetical protein